MRVRKSFLTGKKGDMIVDTILIVVMLLVIGVMMVFGNKVFSDINSQVQSSSSLANATKESINTAATNYPSFMDDLFLTIFVLLWLVLMITSFFIDSHPVFFIIAVVLLVMLLFVAGVASNAYMEFSESSDFDVTGFPKTHFILSNLLMFFLFMAMSVGMVIYGKAQYGGGGGI